MIENMAADSPPGLSFDEFFRSHRCGVSDESRELLW